MSRHQNGYIWKIGRSWYGRWYEDALVEMNGGRELVRRQRSRKLADYCDRYRYEADVRPLLEEILRPLNEGRADARSTLSLAVFVNQSYLPYVRDNLKPSTYHGYVKLWNAQLKARTGDITLRDFRTVNAANLLAALARNGLGRRSLQHAKSLLSGIFTYAKNLGVLDGVNPVRDALLPKKTAPLAETHAVTVQEVATILETLERANLQPRQRAQARAAIALMYFTGLRPGEARGIRWEDYDSDRKLLHVHQSVWNKYTTTPKTASSAKPVPVIEPLRIILAQLHEVDGYPETGPILRGATGKPLSLDNLALRVVVPTLECCAECADSRESHNAHSGHEFQLLPQWHGWYALRRGIATLIATVTKDPMAAKGLLRHSSLVTTANHYIKDVPEVTEQGVRLVERLFAPIPGVVQ